MKQKIVQVRPEKQFYKLTDIINDFLQETGGSGLVNVFVAHTTCGIKVLEGEILLLSDISAFLDKFFPKEDHYRHDVIGVRDVPIDERINGFAHMRQLFFNESTTIPVQDGKMMLGKWQDVFLVELDPIRERQIVITFLSDCM